MKQLKGVKIAREGKQSSLYDISLLDSQAFNA